MNLPAEPGTGQGKDSPEYPARHDNGEPQSSGRRRTTDRATLDRIFGETPRGTKDDLPDPQIPASPDDWYLRERPPHHGG
jgi:hypothetical protein